MVAALDPSVICGATMRWRNVPIPETYLVALAAGLFG
jgi:hypothetical protein